MVFPPSVPESGLPRYAPWLALLGAIALGILQALQVFVSFALAGDAVTLAHAAVTVVSWLLLACLLPLPIHLSRRFSLERGRAWGNWGAHVLGSVAFALIHLAANAALHDARSISGFTEQFLFLLRFFFVLNVVAYWGVVGGVHAWRYYTELQERRRVALTLEMELNAARLATLRARLNPHFLFNTLNSLASLAEEGQGRALADGIGKVSELLRRSLEEGGSGESPLEDEIRAARTYVDVQRLRFGSRLSFEVDADPAALRCAVPTFILQPLLENAIEHGASTDDKEWDTRVVARVADGRVSLIVADQGTGFTDDEGTREGVGLSTVAARLRHLYGDEARLDRKTGPDGGATVILEFPCREWNGP